MELPTSKRNYILAHPLVIFGQMGLLTAFTGFVFALIFDFWLMMIAYLIIAGICAGVEGASLQLIGAYEQATK